MQRKQKQPQNQELEGPLAHYAKALSDGMGEAIHDLIVRRGPAVLRRGIPYLLLAARWRRAETMRTEKRRRDLLHRYEEEAVATLPHSVWDPYDIVSANEALRRVADALSELSDQDALVVWRNAQGVADHDIAAEWQSLGFQPEAPTVDFIRKRRERAREWLRRRLETPV
jgi:hypothetical protein